MPKNAYTIESDGKDMFITMNGKRVAKRGHPGTKHAGQWISLEPGVVIRDVPSEGAIEIEVNGIRVH